MLGDNVQAALAFVGITEARVSMWLGVPCGCAERAAKLNQIEFWARRVLQGRTADAVVFLGRIMNDGDG